jgi:Peptidase A4 family
VTARRWIPWSLVVVLAVSAALTAVLAGQGRAASHAGATNVIGVGPSTGFGGYRTQTNADQISAQWRVPAVLSTSPIGASATWIGLQTHSPSGPFIQLGTYSDQSVSASDGPPKPSSAYGVFWSDTARGFHLVPIVELSRPGDLIAFDMTRNAQGWDLKVHNLTVGWSRSVEVRYAATGRFTQAEWIQEDPAKGYAATTDEPYPSTSPVAFGHLEIDHRPPRLSYGNAQVLSTTDGVFLAPTRPLDDGFALRRPSEIAIQFLTDDETYEAAVAPINLAYYENIVQAGAAPLPKVAAMTRPMSALASRLQSQSWPRSDQTAVEAFVKDIGQHVRALNAWGHNPNKSWTSLTSIVKSPNYLRDGDRLLLSLGLPPSYQ